MYDREERKAVRQMTCKEAQRLVIPYIRHQLDEETMEAFLDHIDGCEECREELEIYYTVEAGIRQLDSDTGHYNIKGDMEADIQASRQQIYQVRMLTIARYAADTLAVLCIAVMLMLQARLWWQNGIF